MIRRHLPTLLIVTAATVAGCSSGGADPQADGIISREAFMDAYFELRASALRNPSQEITNEDRDRILQEHGLTQDDLLRYAEFWGNDPPHMEAVWNELEERMRRTRDGRDDMDEPDPDVDDPEVGPRGVRPMPRPDGGDPDDPPDRGGPGRRGGGR